MGNMYTLDAFNTSNPADQDILSHYKMQQATNIENGNRKMNNWTLLVLGLPYILVNFWIYFSGHKDVEERGVGDANLHQLCPWVQLVLLLQNKT